jgi:hypothetical protein
MPLGISRMKSIKADQIGHIPMLLLPAVEETTYRLLEPRL